MRDSALKSSLAGKRSCGKPIVATIRKIAAILKVWLDYPNLVDVDKMPRPEHHGALQREW